jgi:hypothetical protein
MLFYYEIFKDVSELASLSALYTLSSYASLSLYFTNTLVKISV